MTHSQHTVSAPPLSGYLLGLIGVMIFAATLPMTHLALNGFSPAFITFGRAFGAALVAAAALIVLRRPLPRERRGELFAAGLLLAFGFPGFSSVAMQTVPASHGGIVLGVLPLMTACFAALFGGERPGLLFWAFGIAGTVLVVSFSLSGVDITPGIGDLWLGCAALAASCGYVISGKLSRSMPGWEVIAWALVFISPISLAGTLWSLAGGIDDPGPFELAGFAYLVLGSMFGGFVFWNRGLAIGGIARVGQVQLLQSFFTIAFSAVLLGEAITPVKLAYAFAVAVVVWMGRKAKVG
ncbi:MAG: EamA family transporter [Rhizobiales bacterium]|nr:EamA family transporter [Hyphomicrobiales bacterium]MBA69809.1 EamA family transporter [Hyphomicrobiales bacterium]|tara:strand:- start:798 stop:1685 length:888 start_codon:yes stop_codon:yes gene_type:complete